MLVGIVERCNCVGCKVWDNLWALSVSATNALQRLLGLPLTFNPHYWVVHAHRAGWSGRILLRCRAVQHFNYLLCIVGMVLFLSPYLLPRRSWSYPIASAFLRHFISHCHSLPFSGYFVNYEVWHWVCRGRHEHCVDEFRLGSHWNVWVFQLTGKFQIDS